MRIVLLEETFSFSNDYLMSQALRDIFKTKMKVELWIPWVEVMKRQTGKPGLSGGQQWTFVKMEDQSVTIY